MTKTHKWASEAGGNGWMASTLSPAHNCHQAFAQGLRDYLAEDQCRGQLQETHLYRKPFLITFCNADHAHLAETGLIKYLRDDDEGLPCTLLLKKKVYPRANRSWLWRPFKDAHYKKIKNCNHPSSRTRHLQRPQKAPCKEKLSPQFLNRLSWPAYQPTTWHKEQNAWSQLAALWRKKRYKGKKRQAKTYFSILTWLSESNGQESLDLDETPDARSWPQIECKFLFFGPVPMPNMSAASMKA